MCRHCRMLKSRKERRIVHAFLAKAAQHAAAATGLMISADDIEMRAMLVNPQRIAELQGNMAVRQSAADAQRMQAQELRRILQP